MKITQKKTDGGKVIVNAVASTEEVAKALNSAHLAFAQQMNLRPEQGKTVAQVAEERMGIRDLDSVVTAQAQDALMPFAVNKTGIIPAFRPGRSQVASEARPDLPVRGHGHPQARLRVTSRPVTITVHAARHRPGGGRRADRPDGPTATQVPCPTIASGPEG